MKSEKLKRYRVTQSLRFPSNIIKVLFYTALALLPPCAVVLALGFFVDAAAPLRGVSIIVALLAFIWLFSAKFMSESNFGMANVSFTEDCVIFRTGGAESVEYRLRWDEAECCGMIKTRLAWWCYVSDHELSAHEKKEFPEHAEKGVFYFNYADNTWEEFMKFVPERFRCELEKLAEPVRRADKRD